jgi:flagellar hook assembly protein FlgD
LSEAQPAGYHVAEWNGKNSAGQQLSSGMYFLQLSATGINGKSFNDVRKLMMLK